MIPSVVGTPIETRDGLYWYAMGRWRVSGVPGIPVALGYVPTRLLRGLRNATRLTVNDRDHWKVADLPWREYRDVVARLDPAYAVLPTGPGKTLFLPPERMERVHDPVAAYRTLTGVPTRKNRALLGFVRELELGVNVGIVGSALVQRTTERPEIDLASSDATSTRGSNAGSSGWWPWGGRGGTCSLQPA